MFSIFYRDKTAQQQQVFRYSIATLLGLIGLALNLIPIPLFANVHLVIGNTVVLMCAALMGFGPVMWCCFLAITGLVINFGNPYAYLLFGLEALFVTALRKRGHFILNADLIYWVLVGMPIAFLLITQVRMTFEYPLFGVIKQGFNGVFYAAIASIILVLVPRRWLMSLGQQALPPRDFREKLSYNVVVMIGLSLMISLLVSSAYLIRTQQDLLVKQMDTASFRVGQDLVRTIKRYVDAIEIAGKWMPSSTPLRQRKLTELHQQYIGFSSVVVARNDGSIVAASPASFIDKQPQFVARSHNPVVTKMTTMQTQLTGVQVSEEENGGHVVMASAPWFDPMGNVEGVVEATLNVQYLRSQLDLNSDMKVVVVDSDGQIVIASKEMGIKPLSRLQLTDSEQADSEGIARVKLNGVTEYLEQNTALPLGWTLHVLTPYKPVIQRAEEQFLLGLLMLMAGLLLSTLFTRRLSGHLTKPLEILTKQLALPYQAADSMRQLPHGSAREIVLLHKELAHQRSSIAQYQEELEEQVAKRTVELAEANTKLSRLALRDGLTGAYNRRHFSERFESYRQYSLRSQQPLLLAMLDVDHFKRVNDQHGHLVGDDCLKALVKIIEKRFSRENDLLARYGGEEFVLLLPHLTIDAANQLLEQLRQDVAQSEVAISADGTPLKITISIGALIANSTFSDDVSDWISIADQALYRAKDGGRNRLELEIHVDTTAQDKSLELEQQSALTTSPNELS